VYDTFHISHTLETVPKNIEVLVEKPIQYLGLKWLPMYNKFQDVNGYRANIGNLDLRLKGGVIVIKNSLQKFYMGNNYKSFSYAQVVEAIKELDKQLPFNVYKAKVSYIAVGVVISEKAQPILDTWLSYNGKMAFPMISNNKQYGKKYYLTEYNLKGYDKTVEVYDHNRIRLSEDLFRLELEIKTRNLNKRKNPIGIYTVADLVDKKKFSQLGAELMAKYKLIEKRQEIPLHQLNNKEKEVLALFQNQTILAQYKIDHKDSHKKKRAVYNQLKKKSNNEYLYDIQNTIQEQINYSINN
jgi:hypothetical protein